MELLKLSALLCLTALSVSGREGLYSLEVTDILGERRSLSEYRDKVLLIVNVASECGYTDHNYKELVDLQAEYKDKDFSILGFPCNQFGQQEPGSHEDILKFAKDKYGLNFPLFSKVDVLGNGICGLYKYLYGESASEPSWNFCKYLVDRKGNVVQFFSEKDSFEGIRQSLDYLLSKHTEL